MTKLVIFDLEHSAALDRSARLAVDGGMSGRFDWDQLINSMTNGNLNSSVNASMVDSIFGTQVLTSLNLYMPISTSVMVNNDTVVDTTTLTGNNFKSGSE